MKTRAYALQKKMARAAVVLAFGAIVVSCVAQQPPPQQVESSNPTVTYKYQNDDELIQVNQRADGFCHKYNFISQPQSFSSDSDGSKVVVFECVPTAMSTTNPVRNSNLIYTYRTDQELLNASRNAQAYCVSNGHNQVISNIIYNGDGSKTVTFQCQS